MTMYLQYQYLGSHFITYKKSELKSPESNEIM